MFKIFINIKDNFNKINTSSILENFQEIPYFTLHLQMDFIIMSLQIILLFLH